VVGVAVDVVGDTVVVGFVVVGTDVVVGVT
jgi:hypothetical protein